MKRLYLIVGITSVSIIAFQLALMRYLSIVQFHHYAYMIISVALLGFGASGVLLFLFRNFFLKNFESVIFFKTTLLFILILYSTSIISKFSFDPFLIIWDYEEGYNILFFYLTIFLPFFLGAIILGLSFMKYPDLINKLYFYNLIGSATGGMGIILLMFVIEPFKLTVVVASILLLNIALSISLLKRKVLPISILFVCIFLGFLNLGKSHSINEISEYKSLKKALQFPEVKIVNEMFSPEGWLISLSSPALRYSPGLSLNYQGYIPSQIGIFNDAEMVGAVFADSSVNSEYLNKSTMALPYLFQVDTGVVIGAGTGTEIIRAIRNSVNFVFGIEVNSLIYNIAKSFLEKYLSVKEREKFQLLNTEARAFIQQAESKFDLIFFPLMEGFSSSAAGYYSLFENYLFTVESISNAIEKLNDNGFVCLNTWTNFPPRHAIKIFSLIVDGFKKQNIQAQNNIVAIRSWSNITLLAKKSSLTQDEILKIKNFCTDNSFDLIYYPGIQDYETNKYNILEEDLYYKSMISLLSVERSSFERDYIFNIKSPVDDRPYFSNFINLRNLRLYLSHYGKENLPLYEWGYIILFITFFQIIILCAFFILFPMLFMGKRQIRIAAKLKVFLYFSGIGLGFMFIEILMIQKFILFLSHPIYSVSVVISSILLFAGFGSRISNKVTSLKYLGLKSIALVLIFMVIFYFFLLPEVFKLLIHLPIVLKYFLAILILAPLAFLMGIFFPVGIKNLSIKYDNLIPWAWGINGAVSVVSSVLAPIVSIELGFKFLLLLSCMAYGVIILVGDKFE